MSKRARAAHSAAVDQLRAVTQEIDDLPDNASPERVSGLRDRLAQAQAEEERCKAILERAEQLDSVEARFVPVTADRAARDAFSERLVSGNDATSAQERTPTRVEQAELRKFIRTGEHRASMSYTDANGGYVVPNSVVSSIVGKLKAYDPILGRAQIFNMEGGNTTLEIPVVSALGATAWAGETDARTEQNSPTFASSNLVAYDVYTDWRATQTFIDSVYGIEDWIVNEITETLVAAAGARFATGTGTGQIKGVFANTSSGYAIRLSGAADALANTAFTAAYADLPQAFHPNACWVMAPATFGTVLGYVHPNTQTPLVQFVNGEPTIMGKPVLLADGAPAIGNGAFPVFFGDLAKAYAVGIHRELTILRDPYTSAPYVRFYALMRVGGVPLNNQAGVLIKSDDA